MELDEKNVTFNWQGFEITATMTTGWPMEDNAHIQVRCQYPLLITSTGYRSIFTTFDAVRDAGGCEEYVLKEIEAQATSKEWLQVLDAFQQPSFL